MNLAIIPARGGSKRIINKNIRLFSGRPVIEYSIEVAWETGLFSQVIVSTDCSEIARVAKSAGATVLKRPAELADDHTALIPVVQHAILSARGKEPSAFRNEDPVCCVLATAPLVTAQDLLASFQILSASPEAEFVVPVASFPYPIQRG
jgi:pseudaminic acid cytidylyltransferase